MISRKYIIIICIALLIAIIFGVIIWRKKENTIQEFRAKYQNNIDENQSDIICVMITCIMIDYSLITHIMIARVLYELIYNAKNAKKLRIKICGCNPYTTQHQLRFQLKIYSWTQKTCEHTMLHLFDQIVEVVQGNNFAQWWTGCKKSIEANYICWIPLDAWISKSSTNMNESHFTSPNCCIKIVSNEWDRLLISDLESCKQENSLITSNRSSLGDVKQTHPRFSCISKIHNNIQSRISEKHYPQVYRTFLVGNAILFGKTSIMYQCLIQSDCEPSLATDRMRWKWTQYLIQHYFLYECTKCIVAISNQGRIPIAIQKIEVNFTEFTYMYEGVTQPYDDEEILCKYGSRYVFDSIATKM